MINKNYLNIIQNLACFLLVQPVHRFFHVEHHVFDFDRSMKVSRGRNRTGKGQGWVKMGQIRVEKGQNLPWPILVVDDLVIVLLFRPLYRILMPEKNHKFHENFIQIDF